MKKLNLSILMSDSSPKYPSRNQRLTSNPLYSDPILIEKLLLDNRIRHKEYRPFLESYDTISYLKQI